jgi:hypothetical protein
MPGASHIVMLVLGSCAGTLWDSLCFDLQDRIVREAINSPSVSLVRLHTLAKLCPSFQAAYMSRRASEHFDLLRAALEPPYELSHSTLPTLLALLHCHMTGHLLVDTSLGCVRCKFPRDAHVPDGKWPWLLRCPSDAAVRCGLYPRCFIPSLLDFPRYFCEAGVLKGRLKLMEDGSLKDQKGRRVAPEVWGRECKEGEVGQSPTWRRCRVGCQPKSEAGPSEVANIIYLKNVGNAWDDDGRPAHWLTVRLHGCGPTRRVVIHTEVLSLQELLGYVLALGKGAARMQEVAWLRLEVCHAGEVICLRSLQRIGSLLPVCKEVVLRGPEGVERVYASPTPGYNGFLFESLALNGLNAAAMDGLSKLL